MEDEMDEEAAKNDIISKFQTDILRLEGFKQERGNSPLDTGLGPMITSIPTPHFPWVVFLIP